MAKFPYHKTRLQPIDYEEIIRKGKVWSDPTFPHGPMALFVDGVGHKSHDNWEYKEGQRFYWRRVQDHFKDKDCKTKVMDGVDPTDIY